MPEQLGLKIAQFASRVVSCFCNIDHDDENSENIDTLGPEKLARFSVCDS